MDWQIDFDKEMDLARAARARGNEGQARVCARRAAGVALRAYFARRGQATHSSSAYDLLQGFLTLPDTPAGPREAAGYLVLRVTEEFKLPVNVDLLEQAEILAKGL